MSPDLRSLVPPVMSLCSAEKVNGLSLFNMPIQQSISFFFHEDSKVNQNKFVVCVHKLGQIKIFPTANNNLGKTSKKVYIVHDFTV